VKVFLVTCCYDKLTKKGNLYNALRFHVSLTAHFGQISHLQKLMNNTMASGVKLATLSADLVDSHNRWLKDVVVRDHPCQMLKTLYTQLLVQECIEGLLRRIAWPTPTLLCAPATISGTLPSSSYCMQWHCENNVTIDFPIIADPKREVAIKCKPFLI